MALANPRAKAHIFNGKSYEWTTLNLLPQTSGRSNREKSGTTPHCQALGHFLGCQASFQMDFLGL
jgi:hypothetical protein